ncbi:MAG TPA: 4,5-DOPA dioxygenase extradiol [Zeimonas sp.]
MTTRAPMPAAFIGHGSPMNTLELNRFTAAWRDLGTKLQRPRAVLAISAHWFIKSTAVTAMPHPRVIHDFYGFPRELFEYDYPAPGAPDVAEEIVETVKPSYVGLDRDSWGLDHGTWSVLAHVFPDASVPVLQLSLHAGAPFDYHLDFGRRLAPLRDRGVFIVGSGNVVHNLRRMNPELGDTAYDWAARFDAEVKTIMTTDPGRLASIATHRDYAQSVPTPEHFLPLLYLAGLCDEAKEPARTFVEGGSMGSITMTGYLVGALDLRHTKVDADGAEVPNPASVPPEQTNL